MQTRGLPRKRQKYVMRAILKIIVPLGLLSFFLGYIFTFSLNQAFYFLLFGFSVALLSIFFNILNRVLLYFKIKRLSFLSLQLLKFVTETLVISIFIGIYVHLRYDYHLFSKEHAFLLLLSFLGSAIAGSYIALIVLFNRMAGQQVLQRYFSGKYHIPKEEERIFMFIDLKGSTTIAEQIGHKKFFTLINDILYDISDAIIESDGEIYKYVGDEIIISWSLKKGLKNNNCINLYFEIEHQIEANRSNYLSNYGLVPHFKAGVHVGKVVVGELGDFKSEIAYMGDAVNTTARIQSECNAHSAKLLISKELLNLLYSQRSFQFEELDKLRLKGKLTDTVLVKVTQ